MNMELELQMKLENHFRGTNKQSVYFIPELNMLVEDEGLLVGYKQYKANLYNKVYTNRFDYTIEEIKNKKINK